MQPSTSTTTRLDASVLCAWREGMAQAVGHPDLKQQLLQRERDLLPRFAAQYTKLRALPRRVRRRLQRQWKRSLAGLALLLALGTTPALAATINVGGGCLLVDAITAANTDNAIGLCKAGRGSDTIVLPANSTQTLTQVNNQFVGPSGLPVITSTITIAGNGSTIARSSAPGTPEFRILVVGQSGNLTLKKTKVTGGSLSRDSRGGGVYRQSGTLTLIGCTISGNSAYLGGGVANSVGGTLTVTNSTVSGNTATGNQGGGGMFNNGNVGNQDGILKVINSTVSGNTAKFGGGLRNDGTATITNSTFSGNTATSTSVGGGGVANVFSGSLTLTNSTVSGNSASNSGGGVDNYQGVVTLANDTISGNTAKYGGGASNNFGRMFFGSSTVSGNTATSKGGGVYNSRLSGRVRSDVVLGRTLISGNTAPSGAEVYQASGGVLTSNSNLFGHSGLTNAQAVSGGGVIVASSDINATSDGTRPTALNAILNPTLANNGGLTQTHALVAGSPAIDAVTNGTCPPPATDQRGIARPQDGNRDAAVLCDIGAFELAPVSGG